MVVTILKSEWRIEEETADCGRFSGEILTRYKDAKKGLQLPPAA
jgi:hypothetical protein